MLEETGRVPHSNRKHIHSDQTVNILTSIHSVIENQTATVPRTLAKTSLARLNCLNHVVSTGTNINTDMCGCPRKKKLRAPILQVRGDCFPSPVQPPGV